MKLVIDISDALYQSVLDGIYCGTLYKELKNGTPIPDWISANNPPKEKGQWLCCDENGRMEVGFYSVLFDEWSFSDNFMDRVIAYMPLPKRYFEPEDEE